MDLIYGIEEDNFFKQLEVTVYPFIRDEIHWRSTCDSRMALRLPVLPKPMHVCTERTKQQLWLFSMDNPRKMLSAP